MIRGYRDPQLNGDEQLRWDQHSISRDNPRSNTQTGYRPFEERAATRPFGQTRIPSDPYPATRIIIVSNNTGHGMSPRLPQSSHGLMPRFIGHENMPVPTETDGSKLTKEEQEIVLKKLKKQIYNPMPKILARRVSLYYRDLNRELNNTKALENHKDEEGKSCAVCLEDFEPKQEVMLTPCSHMFHEECIVPWVRDHGQCPVCRASFYERRENGSALINNRQVVIQPAGQRVLFSDELLSLFQAVDEAFPWRF